MNNEELISEELTAAVEALSAALKLEQLGRLHPTVVDTYIEEYTLVYSEYMQAQSIQINSMNYLATKFRQENLQQQQQEK